MNNKWTIPPRNLPLRWALIVVSVLVVIWTGLEDDRIWLAAALGVSLTGISLAHWLTGRLAGRTITGQKIALAWAGFGALTGGLGAFTTVVLMAFKDARHAHPFPDSPAGLLAAILGRAPHWALAGALIGIGIYAAWRAHNRR